MSNSTSQIWELIVKEPINVNCIIISPGTILGVKDKFPGGDDNSIEKGIWQIKDSYGGLFLMNYEDQKYFEGVK